ncbi:MAG: hypothetical protein ACC662_11875, partial [Planctomycetota bacterium]
MVNRKRAPFGLPVLLVLLLLAPGTGKTTAGEVDAERLVARVRVAGPGFVRLAASRLQALGLGEPATLDVRRRGRPVPRAAPATEGNLVFFGQGVPGRPTTPAVYEIWRLPRSAPPAPPASPAPV